jgi:hypothetical protein
MTTKADAHSTMVTSAASAARTPGVARGTADPGLGVVASDGCTAGLVTVVTGSSSRATTQQHKRWFLHFR